VSHLTQQPPDASPAVEPPAEGRLDSWKEIAVYLRRDVRTVQRWEKSEGLPVRRHLHDSLGSVYAYRHELDAWREGRQPAPGGPEAGTARVRRRLHWAALGGLVVVASAGLVATRPSWNGQGTAPVLLRVVQLTNDRQEKGGALATDGSRLYFSQRVNERVVVKAMPVSGGEPETVPIPLTAPFVLDVSPDGSEMLLVDESDRVLVENVMYASPLYRMPKDDGTPRRVGDVMVHSASWLPDGRTILCAVGRQLKLVDRDGGSPRTLATFSGVPGIARPAPDGRCIRFWLVDQSTGTWSLWEMALDGTAPRPLLPGWDHGKGGASGSWSPAGDYFFVSGYGGTPSVWVLPGRKGWGWLEGRANPARLTTISVTAGLSLAGRDGQRFFLMAGLEAGEVVGWDAKAPGFVPHPAGIPGSMVDFSRDGGWIVYVAFPSMTLWRARADGTERQRLTDPPLEVALPRWSPDGARVAFQARAPGEAWRIYAVPSTGGPPVPLADGQGEDADPTWSPDGRRLVFGHASGGTAPGRLTLRVLDLATGRTSELPGSEGKFSPRWSPDGRHVAALPADWQKLLVLDLDTGQWSEPVMGAAGFQAWSRDGARIYFQRTEEGDVNVIYRLRLADGHVERVVSRQGVPRSYSFCGAWFGLDPEDRVLVMRDRSVVEIFAFDYAWP
jgi:Tol biopolymer transport system component